MTAPNGTLQHTLPDVRGKRVLVYSLGMEGRDLARWLLAHEAKVTISDTRSDAALIALAGTMGTTPDSAGGSRAVWRRHDGRCQPLSDLSLASPKAPCTGRFRS